MLFQVVTRVYNDFLLDLLFIVSLIVTQFAAVALALIGYLQSRQNHAKITEVQRTLDDKAVVVEKVQIPLDRLDHMQ